MLLPSTYAITLALVLLSVICWGSWANTLKSSKWRFELFYMDFGLGVLLTSLIAAFTIGSMGTDLSASDSYLLVGKRSLALAFVAGCVLNLGHMLIVGGMEVSGMSIALPVGFSMSVVVTAIWQYFAAQQGKPLAVFGGAFVLLIAVVLAAIANSQNTKVLRKAAEAAKAALAASEPQPLPGSRRKKHDEDNSIPSSGVGTSLAIAGGLVMGAFFPILGMGMEGEAGFSNPLAAMMMIAAGILVSTFIYNLYFINLPVKGLPVSFFAYFTGRISQHFMGFLGGVIWTIGICAILAAGAAQGEAKVGATFSLVAGQAAAIVGIVWGLITWKEFALAKSGTVRLLMVSGGFVLAGIGVIASTLLG